MRTEPKQSTWIGRLLRSVAIPSRLKEEILAFLLFVGAVILTLPLLGQTDGALLGSVASGLWATFGLAALGAPIGLAILSVELWRADNPGDRARRLFGGALLGLAIVGLLTLGNPEADWADSGGWLGDAVTALLKAVIGEVATAIALFSIGLVGVILVTGSDSRSLGASWRRLRARNYYDASIETAPIDLHGPASRDSTNPIDSQNMIDHGTTLPNRPEIRAPAHPSGLDEIKNAVAVAASTVFDEVRPRKDDTGWKLPKLSLLTSFTASKPDETDLEAKARRIEETLESFKVDATVREVFPGPAVTLFALEPGHGVKVSKITGLQNDLALALAAPSIRIEAPVPGMARVGIEIPNADISTVGLRDIIDSTEMRANKAKLPLPLGRDVNGRPVIADLARMPHLLIAGATGSGKSVSINTIIATFLLTRTPDELQMLLIDPKKVELVGYRHVPHLKGPIVTEMDKVVSALRLVLHEMDRRYQMFARTRGPKH